MRWISRPGWPGHLLALAAGAHTLALAPFDYWPLAILSIALLYLGLRGLPGKSALWRLVVRFRRVRRRHQLDRRYP